MYQQRWKNLAIGEEVPAYAIPIEGIKTAAVYRVLQCRIGKEYWTGENKEPDIVWSEWEDVTYE